MSPRAGGAASLKRDIARLVELQRELRLTLDRVDRTLQRVTIGSTDGAAVTGAPARRALRLQVLDMLEDLGTISYSRELTAYAQARYDRVIAPGRFGTLASDERKAFERREAPRSRNRTVWLCFGLRHDDAAPVKRLIARSDWPLPERIWAPTSGRVQRLRMTIRLCEIALNESIQFADPARFHALVRTYAEDLPIRVIPGASQYVEWRDRAQELLDEGDLRTRDYELRTEAAERWGGLSDLHQLFGRELDATGVAVTA